MAGRSDRGRAFLADVSGGVPPSVDLLFPREEDVVPGCGRGTAALASLADAERVPFRVGDDLLPDGVVGYRDVHHVDDDQADPHCAVDLPRAAPIFGSPRD